jgi:hypothetical protein
MRAHYLWLPIVYLQNAASFAEKSFGEFMGAPFSSGPMQQQPA